MAHRRRDPSSSSFSHHPHVSSGAASICTRNLPNEGLSTKPLVSSPNVNLIDVHAEAAPHAMRCSPAFSYSYGSRSLGSRMIIPKEISLSRLEGLGKELSACLEGLSRTVRFRPALPRRLRNCAQL